MILGSFRAEFAEQLKDLSTRVDCLQEQVERPGGPRPTTASSSRVQADIHRICREEMKAMDNRLVDTLKTLDSWLGKNLQAMEAVDQGFEKRGAEPSSSDAETTEGKSLEDASHSDTEQSSSPSSPSQASFSGLMGTEKGSSGARSLRTRSVEPEKSVPQVMRGLRTLTRSLCHTPSGLPTNFSEAPAPPVALSGRCFEWTDAREAATLCTQRVSSRTRADRSRLPGSGTSWASQAPNGQRSRGTCRSARTPPASIGKPPALPSAETSSARSPERTRGPVATLTSMASVLDGFKDFDIDALYSMVSTGRGE